MDGPLTIEDIVNGLSRQTAEEYVLPVAPAQTPWSAPLTETPKMMLVPEPAHVAEVAPTAMRMRPQAPARAEVSAVHQDVPAFLSALLAAEKTQVFAMIRELNKAGENVEEFLTHVVVALDDAYRAKIDGTPVHTEVARVCVDCAPSFLERVIASLTTVVDGSYMTGITGVKLAVTRALHAVEG